MTKTLKISIAAIALFAVAAFGFFVFADSATLDFESYTLGNINGQDGWSALGSAGSGCAVYDVEVSDSFGVPGFGDQSLRISNAVTSGCFGDQTFSKSLADETGETTAQNGGMSGGTRQNHFEAEFEIRPMQLSQQPGLFLSVSPDRGDGARMSYLGFRDDPDGIRVNFYDVTSIVDPATFSETVIATGLSRAVNHKIKFVIDFVDGPSNDVVEIYINDVLVHTGTTWENYFRFDDESNPSLVNESRTVDSLLFRAGGTAAPATSGLGYLIDNVALTSSTVAPPPDVTVTIVKYVDDVHATAGSASSLSFPMDASWSATNIGSGSGSFALSTVGFNNPNEYEATTSFMTNGADYSVSENLTGPNVGASCSESKPFAFAGYSIGDTELLAAAAAMTSSAVLTGITSDKFIIVWNDTCAPAPTTATLTLEKVVVNDDSGNDDDTDWTLSANGPTPISGVEGNASVTSADVVPGSYDLSESGPSGYTASAWVCTGTTQNDGDTITVAAGETITCTITNDDDDTPPPPPSGTACDTPGSAPSGYTLLTGTVDRDVVTLNPFTMFVGLGGNDDVRAPALGSYIICVGDGFDRITIGDGVYNIAGGQNYKNIIAGNGNGMIFLGDGPNRITTGNGDHNITVGNGNNNITTGSGVDTITAGNGFNRINAGGGNDDILTGSSNDNVNGGADTDTCDAGAGFNTVTNCEL